MPINVGLKNEFDLIATDADGDPCIFPRDPSNQIFVDAFDFKTKIVDDTQPNRYLAFPFVVKVGASLIGIFSDNEAHAVGSSGQWMIRSDDNGATWEKVKFFDAAAPTIFDTSLLVGVLSTGNSVVLKIWTIKNNAGTLDVTVQSTVSFGGNTYPLWSKSIPGASGKLWRTAYGNVSGNLETILCESSDGVVTWTGVTTIFADAGKIFTEADIVKLDGTTWYAMVREDVGDGNPVYESISEDDGATWSSPALIPTAQINGRQPNLIKTTDGSIIFSSGDRSGSSSYASDGSLVPFLVNTTGITVYRKPMATLGANPLTSTSGSATINISQSAHGYATGDIVFVFGATDLNGIPAAEINGFHTITRINSTVYQITVSTTASSSGAGGGNNIKNYNMTKWGFRTRIAGVFSTDGGQPFTNEISLSNYVNTVFYHRRAVDENPIIASATYFTTNL
jgi:hypothetical protein